jgi:two-component system, NarL family, sensor histidine kinase DesK
VAWTTSIDRDGWRCRPTMDRPPQVTASDERADALGGPARLATWGAIAICLALPLIDLWRWIAYSTTLIDRWGWVTTDAAVAVAATVLYLPLHLRHVAYGLRGERAPHAAWSLPAMTVVIGVAALVIGPPWAVMLASLALSILIVLPWPWSIVPFTAIVAAPLAYGLHLDPAWPVGTTAYLSFSVALVSVPLFVVVWLVAATRQLDAARAALSDLAVVGERIRIDGELGRTVGAALETIVAESGRAERLIDQPGQAEAAVRSLVMRSREALAHGRRTVGSYQQVTVHSQLDAATTLLAAAGVDAQLVVEDAALLSVMDDRVTSQLRSLVARLLRDGPSRCAIELEGAPDNPTVRVAILDATKARARDGGLR